MGSHIPSQPAGRSGFEFTAGQEQELGQDIQRLKEVDGRLAGSKPKRRPATDAMVGFLTMGRSEAAQAGVIGSDSSKCSVVSLITGPRTRSHTGLLEIEGGLFGWGV